MRKWIAGGILLVVAAFLAFHLFTALSPLPIVVPTPVMPNPNGYDFFVRAGNALVREKQIGDPKANAAKILSENAEAMRLARQGFGYRCVHPPVRGGPTTTAAATATFARDAKMRGLARLFRLDGSTRASGRDWGGAASSDLDAIELGVAICHGAKLMDSLIGSADVAIGRADLWDVIDHLNAGQARSVTGRLDSIFLNKASFADVMTEEKWWGIDERRTTYPAGISLFTLTWSKRAVIRNFANYMDAVIAQSKLSYPQRQTPVKTPADPFNAMIVPVYRSSEFSFVRNDTEDALLIAKLALRTYFTEHGTYPNSLNDLTPNYLKTVPIDPFGTGPLKYQTTGAGYLLYSIGPDCVDDGGKPIDDPTHVGHGYSVRARYFPKEQSKGDIVAGINR